MSHMGYTYDTAATSLGVSRGTYADWIAGTSRTTGTDAPRLRCCWRVAIYGVMALVRSGLDITPVALHL